MLRINLRLVLFFLTTFYSFSQDQTITLDEIWNGTFSTQRMEALHSMNNGKQYSVLNFNRTNRSTSVDVYDYKTQDKIATLVDSKNLEDIPYFTNYDFSEDERKIILATDIESVYRHSTLGVFFVYDTTTKTLQKILKILWGKILVILMVL